VMRSFNRNADGTTAIEFAMVGAPFMALLFGIIAVGLYFFTVFSMENAVEQASRIIRTGQAQQTGLTPQQFKDKLCEYVPGHIDCANKVFVNVKSFANSSDITAASLPKCLDGDGNLKTSSDFVPGTQNVVVLVWVCYEWEMAKFPYINLGDMGNGSMLVQATTTFRTEPYTN
jgi:Flp pilus assembly protein TadG